MSAASGLGGVALLERAERVLPERCCTLYGTAIWDRLTPQQRLDLRGHETSHVAATQAGMAAALARMTAQAAGMRDRPAAARLAAALLGYEVTSSYLGGQAAHQEPAVECGYARAELIRATAKVPPAGMRCQRVVLAHAALTLTRSLVSAEAYRRAGLDTGHATRAALASPYHREAVCLAGEKTMAFLSEAGLAGAPGTAWWRRSFLLR